MWFVEDTVNPISLQLLRTKDHSTIFLTNISTSAQYTENREYHLWLAGSFSPQMFIPKNLLPIRCECTVFPVLRDKILMCKSVFFLLTELRSLIIRVRWNLLEFCGSKNTALLYSMYLFEAFSLLLISHNTAWIVYYNFSTLIFVWQCLIWLRATIFDAPGYSRTNNHTFKIAKSCSGFVWKIQFLT